MSRREDIEAAMIGPRHPATEKAWAWLLDNIETMEPGRAESIERVLRNLDRELWELGPGSLGLGSSPDSP